MDKVGFLEEAPGVKSSTRRNSWYLLWFFFLVNFLIVGLMFYIVGNAPEKLTLELIAFILTYDFMLLIAVFAPKYLHKRTEVSEVIEGMKIKNPT